MTILDKIFESKRRQLADLQQFVPISELQALIAHQEPARMFRKALENADVPVSLIAEVKKASPSRGVIRENFDPVEIAKSYEWAGAQCLSVLTDVEYFQGSPEYLRACRNATQLPVLRKDFTTSEYHVYEARAMGADAVLLIVNGLDDVELRGFRELAEGLGMDVIVEAHNLDEAVRALESGATIVGVNNRNLETFEEDIETACQVIPEISNRALIVSESSLKSNEDVMKVSNAGARSVLIGTTFSRAVDIGAKVREVMGW